MSDTDETDSPGRAEPAPAPQAGEERGRVLRLIDFLADYDAQRNPPVYDITKYALFLLRDKDLPDVPGVTLSPAGPTWLTVDFLDLPATPRIPDELVPLLGQPDAISPHIRPAIIGLVADGESDGQGAEDFGYAGDAQRHSPELVETAEAWIATVWQPFADQWAQVSAAKALHRELFRQRELLAMNRESVELVWGFGRLRWSRQGVVLDHPLLTIPVEVERDEASQRIRVCPAGAPEVEARCLAGLSLADRAGYMSVRQSVNDEGADLWDADGLRDVLQLLVRSADDEGRLADVTGPAQESAVADGSWVLFMRRRLPDYQGFLEEMRALYKDGAVAVPDTLQAVVCDAPSELAVERGPAGSVRDEAEPLLLPLPTNEEQQRILSQAQHSIGVTVQGPPGTGKSHTIANIISHYVAYGKRVLVVAEKEQALRSLKTKIPAGIADLTVSVLGADAENRKQLESAISQIQTRVTGIDKSFADQRIQQLTADLDRASRAIAETTAALLETRAAEVAQLPGSWLAGPEPTRAQAARWVAAEAARLGYIDDVLGPDGGAPLSAGELAELTSLIRQVGVARADACAAVLPELDMLPSAGQLSEALSRQAGLRDSVRALSGAVHDWQRAVAYGADGLAALSARADAEREWLAGCSGTWLGTIREQAGDALLAQDWAAFGGRIAHDRQEAMRLRSGLTAHDITLPDVVEPAFIAALQEARERLADSGRLGMFAGTAKRAVQGCSVDGRQPSTASDIDLCLQATALQETRRRLMTGWHNQLARVDGPDLAGAAPEDVVGTLLDALARALHWPRAWAELRGELATAGIGSPPVADPQSLAQLRDVSAQAVDQIRLQEVTRQLDDLGARLQAGTEDPGASPVWLLLGDALDQADLNLWHRLRQDVRDLHEIAPAASRLRELRGRLAAAAPVWTSRILAQPLAAGEPGDLASAWQWRQLDCWVRHVLSGPTPAQLQARLEELSQDRRRTMTDLVAERAWRRLADNLGDRQRQALNSYLRAVTRFGKTGGKFAQRWLAEIRAALNESKDAVPVWIMPTARALSSFRPEASPPFDVLIIDEASQIGLEALPLFALARQAIVVGDDKQTSPENVGLDRQQVFDLLDDHLAMVPKYRTLFDPDSSLYDIAFQKFPGVVMLTEHFRCLPQIISFSSAHAYDNRIIPLRDQAPRLGWAPLGAIRVRDGYRSGYLNEPEADAVVDLVAELCADPDYAGMDMGVISLLGSVQSKHIWEKLHDRLGQEEMLRRRLRCGEPANFQGDERDVIIISTVAAVDPTVPGSRIAAATGNAATRRINVAASRARQQMWVVHSVDASQFREDDLRGALIKHCHEAGSAAVLAGDLLSACESQFERDVIRRILNRGYHNVAVQHQVGRFRIDIVVEGASARLAVECDGDRWHGPDVWHQDRARQQVLERAGWTFERIRGSAFYRDPDAALAPLWDRLAQLGIAPGDRLADAPTPLLREVSAHNSSGESYARDTDDQGWLV